MIRLTESHDWVIFLILGCIAVYTFMLWTLQREATLREYILQPYEDSHNGLLCWLLASAVYAALAAALLLHFIPVVPEAVAHANLPGWETTRYGYAFGAFCVYFLLKSGLGYLLFSSAGDGHKWGKFYFSASKFYFCASLLLMPLCLALYLFPIDRRIALTALFSIFLGLFFIKHIYYLSEGGILPERWYYKILYICTLQILPALVLWKSLFS